ncbi:surface protein (fragment) [Streptococcus pneumoniae]
MKEFQFERKQRFSLRKYAIGACSVLLGTSLFFAGMGAQPVQDTETSSALISSHYYCIFCISEIVCIHKSF